ncbi:GDP-Man:Man(3)GlcNAc(2)-PP-Dol alpha-1,2-mannosyltransferase isoform X1 [Vespa crabro]|uniref:GDP-Man:Man(3)GlcNAc(2)-PP-Dol alpha-1,2-mannosyltransferase isoform X1 n=2 Tax=Vespa crabro TaxID=7445 RepID=UPI001EFF7DD3|nr:GDP-Man:Man(3)GlcNAc(2)-PP-Dol alpha-1,2-mannosyltransferase isoform X1 [Vespa crabro]XP_046818540.1 GDP-Man:Man(3)GlcNAc(2)-PP-Dol alpha-1,2-mannosyltransferase isoform X1 [Vespa crabro]XP_046818541.1 GDP-Man:Man(3)GlcNAc(2)-PP-Dol alpha-1,2-mannosyltransferase isoform X1 [Vespa crabro]
MNIYSLLTPIILIVNMTLIIIVCTLLFVLLTLPMLLIYWRRIYAKERTNRKRKGTVVAFFHPYCNAGGGGERVLWAAIKAIQSKYPNIHIVIYTGDLDADPEQILNRSQKSFNIKIQSNIKFIYLHKRKWVEAQMYPYFTLLGQSLGSIWLGIEALNNLVPDIYIDTMGYAFTYPLFRYIGGCKVASYTHYPTISTDMLRHVYKRVISHNNRRIIARNPFLSAAKIAYYRLFALLYGLAGRTAEIVMVNSSWTEEHINAIWKCPLRTHRIYPPTNVQHLTSLPLFDDTKEDSQIRIVSIAQFRPEKNHPLMLRTMYELRSIVKEEVWEKIRLVFIGSCRDKGDEVRVKDMQDLSKHFALDENVEFKLNIPYSELVSELQKASIGLHAMWNEHFGISIVECMATGLIMIAHDSGGPRADIIETQPGSQTGFLAEEAEEYAKIIAHIINMYPEDKKTIRLAARASVSRFSSELFELEVLRAIEPFFRQKQE